MRFPFSPQELPQHVRWVIRVPARTGTLLLMIPLLLTLARSVLAQTGDGSLTLVKEAVPADGTDFVLAPTLTPLGAFDSSESAAGGFVNPEGIAAGQNGALYVTDSGNQRIQQFDAAGNFVRAWGWGVDSGASAFEVCTDPCQAGSSGGGAGQFNNPYGIAAAPGTGDADFVYVVDSSNHRVQQFEADESGVDFVRAWGRGVATGAAAFETCSGPCQSGTAGSGAGHFNGANGVAVGEDGSVYVTDLANYRVQQFEADGDFVRAWGWNVIPGAPNGFEICTVICGAGAFGGGAGQFDFPYYVAAGPGQGGTLSVYIGDYNNERIQQFTETGTFVRTWGRGVATGAAAFEVCTSTCQAGTQGSGVGQFAGANGVAMGQDGTLYATDYSNQRVLRFLVGDFLLDDAAIDDSDAYSDTFAIAGLPDASYAFAEDSPADWTLEDVDCTGGTLVHSGSAFTLTITGGAQITCTLTNVPLTQTLTVDKVVAGGGPLDADDFPLFIDDDGVTRGVATLLDVGTYTVTETGDPRYTASFGGACDSDGEVTLSIGAHITCTITNTYITQTLTVDKVVAGGGPLDADDFPLFIDGAGVARGAANQLAAGAYTVTETSDPRYTATFGGACDSDGEVTLSIGAHITCTITNSYITQTLTVDKVVAGGPLDADDFPLFVNGNGVTRGAANLLDAGIYSVTETSDPAYTASFGGDCDSDGEVILGIGDDLTCTVTNTYITQTLTVNKVVVGGGPLDADDFPLFIDGNGVTRGAANLLTAGAYTVTETGDPRYSAAFGGDCDDEGNVTLDIGAHLTCTVTNTYITQTLTVDTVVVGGGPLDADDFPLFIDNVGVTRGAATLLDTGTHTVTETGDPRYTASYGGACDEEGKVMLAVGDDLVCTVTNTYITQTLTVNKIVAGGGPLDGDDFPLFINSSGVTRGAANLLAAGPYIVTETSDPRYTASFGGACNSDGEVTLGIGDDLVCTITNTYITQTLTVNKVVAGGGPLDADDFPLFVDGNGVARGVANLLAAGSHVVTETSDARYTASFGGACDEEGNVTLGIGDDLICTVTNTFITEAPTQTLTVNKTVVGGGPLDAGDFPLFINGSGVTRGAANLLAAGTYTVSETSNDFYVATFGGDCDENGAVTLGTGEHLTCTITNEKRLIFLPGIATKPE